MENYRGPAHIVTHIFIILLLFCYPLIFSPDGYVNITETKLAFLAALSGLWLFALAVCGFISLFRGSRPVPRVSSSGFAVIVFLLIACASALVSPYGWDTVIGAGRFDGLLSLALYCAIFLGVSTFGCPREMYPAVFAVSVSICCVIAILQLFGLDPFWLFPGDYTYYDAHIMYTGEFLGTVGNANLLSAILSLALPLFSAMFITGVNKNRSLYLLPMMLCAYVLAASRVAGGAVAVIACAVFSAPVLLTNAPRIGRALVSVSATAASASFALMWSADYTNRQFKASLRPEEYAGALLVVTLAAALLFLIVRAKKLELRADRLRKTLWICIAAGALVFILTVYLFPFQRDTGTLFEFNRILHGEIRGEFGSSRIHIWREALRLFAERPLLGGGPGTAALRLDIEFSRYVPETGRTLRTFVDNAHNDFIGYLIDLGAFGLLAYLVSIVLTTRVWLTRCASSLGAAVGCGLTGYWIQSFFGLNLFIAAPFMWVFWGLFNSENKSFPAKRIPDE